MNRIEATKIFKTFRVDGESAKKQELYLEEVEELSDEKIISEWKTKVSFCNFGGYCGRIDWMHIALLEQEMQEREAIDTEALKKWYKEAEENYIDPEAEQ